MQVKVEENENSGYINLLEILSTIDHFLFPKFMYSRNKKSKHEKRFNLEDYEMNILSTKELKLVQIYLTKTMSTYKS